MSSAAAAHRTPILGTLVRETTLVLGLAVTLGAASRIAFPLGFTPVPVTAQTFVVLVGGALLGARRAGSGAATYLALGLAGVPWFATGGATVGYLVGFVVAAMTVGRAARTGHLDRRISALVVMAVAHAAIYVVGATWLAVLLGVGPVAAFTLGVAPFLIGDTIKVVVAGLIAPALVRAMR